MTRRPKATANWTVQDQARAQITALNWLDGLGLVGNDVVEIGHAARHVRRALTDAEIARLPRNRATGPNLPLTT